MGAFLTGALGYPLLELLIRGRTHYSMGIAGGLSMQLILRMDRMHLPLLHRSLLCGVGITAIEYACGLVWNRTYRIWDYRKMPLNLHGQICAPYTLLWCIMSAAILKATNMMHQSVKGN